MLLRIFLRLIGFFLCSLINSFRFCLYKTGPLLIVNHGMGGPSISIMLHEITKLLHYAEARAVYIRMGTSGGVGVPPGSVIVSQKVGNPKSNSDVPGV